MDKTLSDNGIKDGVETGSKGNSIKTTTSLTSDDICVVIESRDTRVMIMVVSDIKTIIIKDLMRK